jgi:hypothetical protein
LIDSYLSYPCDNCQEDDLNCILITPRNEKRICEHCKHKRLHCSYTNDGEDSIAACNNCQDANVTCIAGPSKTYRIDDVLGTKGNKGSSLKAAAKTQYSSCTSCYRNQVRNFPISLSQSQICRQCLIGSSSATPKAFQESVKVEERSRAPPKEKALTKRTQLFTSNKSFARPGKRSKKQQKVENPHAKKINSKFDSNLEAAKPKFSASVPGGKVKYITTSFCHPIQFNWTPPPPLSPPPYSPPKLPSEIRAFSFPCHFCTDPGESYAMVGLGVKRVQVIQWQHDHTAGYEELEDGWVQEGQESTRVCTSCTMRRTLIFCCPDHMIRPIKNLDPRTFDFDTAFQGLLSQFFNRGKPDHEKVVGPKVKWCSICLEPAFFECCVRPPFTSSGLETSPADDIGCGLLLCEVCATRMTGRNLHSQVPPASHKKTVIEMQFRTVMTLDEHINAAAKDTFHYQDGLRADVCFLKANSELMRRQGAGGGEDATSGICNEDEIDTDDDHEYDELHDRAFKKRNWGMGSPIDLT